jgi:hypothetical protein
MHSPADVSSFYLGNEELVREITRLLDEGSLVNLLTILKDYGVTLSFEARREDQGLREKIGVLGTEESSEVKKATELPLYQDHPNDPLLRSKASLKGVWDPLATLCTRSRFTIVRRGGELEEVYMPDHVCPECLNDVGNKINSCDRVCVMCDFEW